MGTVREISRSRAGKSVWKTHRRNLLPVLALATVAALGFPFFIFAFVLGRDTMDWWVAPVGILLVAPILLVTRWWDKQHGNHERGARGEVAAGRELERLHKEGFHIFHDYKPEGRRGNVDHFIVGESGIFVVETKAWTGEISSDGQQLLRNGRPLKHKNPITQVKGEAKDVHELVKQSCGMDVWVQPILCFGSDELRHYAKVDNVEVVDLGSLRRSVMQLASQNWDCNKLTPSQVRVISDRLQKKLGERPAASPGNPPPEPGTLKKILRPDRLFVAIYTLFFLGLSVYFAENTAKTLQNLATLYLFLSSILNF